MNYGLFRLGDRAFAVPVSSVREVLQQPVISPVPLAPELLAGMVLFRGEVLPVFETGILFGAELPRGVRSRVLVIQHNGAFAGLAADHASIASGSPVSASASRFFLPQVLELAAGSVPLIDVPALFQELESCLTPAA
jgi:chemotaxis signal transduction protein